LSKVFVSVGMSLDGMIAGSNRGPTNPLGDHGVEIHSWAYTQEAFRKNLELGPGGETGTDNRILGAAIRRTGANIMGKRDSFKSIGLSLAQQWRLNAAFD